MIIRAGSDYDDEHRRSATEHEHDGLQPELVLISGGNPEITLIGPLVLSYERE